MTFAWDITGIEPGSAIKVTGVVTVFKYDEYVESYSLQDEAPLYEPFQKEEFRIAKKIDTSINGTTPTS